MQRSTDSRDGIRSRSPCFLGLLGSLHRAFAVGADLHAELDRFQAETLAQLLHVGCQFLLAGIEQFHTERNDLTKPRERSTHHLQFTLEVFYLDSDAVTGSRIASHLVCLVEFGNASLDLGDAPRWQHLFGFDYWSTFPATFFASSTRESDGLAAHLLHLGSGSVGLSTEGL